MNHEQLVKRFATTDKTSGTASNMYIQGNVLYSYGSHFPLLVKMPKESKIKFLLNADYYSSSTSRHQAECIKYADVQIPFSVLNRAGIPYESIEVIHNLKPISQITGYRDYENSRTLSVAEFKALPDNEKYVYENGILQYEIHSKKVKIDGKITWEQYTSKSPQLRFHPRSEQRVASVVIKCLDKYYLSSIDFESSNNWRGNYFLSQLPREVKTVKQAFSILKPKQINGKKYLRQGEWFFIPCKNIPSTLFWKSKQYKKMYKLMQTNFILPRDTDSANPHKAIRGCIINDIIYVSGFISHPEHKRIKLSKANNPLIYTAWRNTAIESFSSGGWVD